MIERERTFLALKIPDNLLRSPSKEIVDIYIPKSATHCILRIRKNGDTYEMTKKEPIAGKDSSEQTETTIPLTREEYEDLTAVEGKRSRKIRYFFPFNARTAEIGVFKDALEGLILIDFEFETTKEMTSFAMPDFCLADVTQEGSFAGGSLAGRSYEDIKKDLDKFGYKKLFLQ